MKTPEPIGTFILVDGAMLGESVTLLRSGDTWRQWLVPVYEGEAASVGPIVIDIEAAYESGEIDLVMMLANLVRPALHASFIDTPLPLTGLAQHLKHFVVVVHENGRQQSLRFADGAILPELAAVLSEGQWATICSTFARWLVHDRVGTLIALPPAQREHPREGTPLRLSQQQIAALVEAAEPDRMLHAVREQERARLAGTPAEQHRWAKEAYLAWRESGNDSRPALYSLTATVIETRGGARTQALA